MIELKNLVELLKKEKFGPIMGVPCSVFKHFLNFIINKKSFEHYACSSEGESLGLAAGFAMAGKYPIIYMQNDGYGNVINPLSSLQLMYELPALLMISWRGEPGKKDAPQHKLMGETLLGLLEIFDIPYAVVNKGNIESEIVNAKKYMKKKQKPYALIFKKGTIENFEVKKEESKLNNRYDYLEILKNCLNKYDIILGTTGFTGRELFQTVSCNSKFYMMGSMGCLSSMGLGLAKSYHKKTVYVLDGDGALLMKLGSLSTIGNYQPDNLIHICFDNNQYESTGGQKTTASTTNFVKLAEACNYKKAIMIDNTSHFEKIISKISLLEKPLFLHIKITSGTIENLKRPSFSPIEMKKKFMESL
jgi:phosphonopyruvate decarboxylase